jgi:anti-sigma factor RsiW
MTNHHDSMPTPIDDETLVAYLDDELSRDQRARVELSLRAEPELQQRLGELQASWDLLGDLPAPIPRRDLTQSTIAMVTLALDSESPSWGAWLAKNRLLTLGLAGLAMLLAGATSSRALTQYMTRQILANLPSIVDLPALQNVDSPEFLHALLEIDNLVAAAGTQVGRAQIGNGRVPLAISDRQSWVEQLKEDSRGRLESNLSEYSRLPDSQQRALRSVADEIYADPAQNESYLRVVRAYNSILERWGTKPRAMLQTMSVPDRIAAIRARVAVLMALSYVPSAQDREVFRNWLEAIVQKQDASEQLFYYNYDAQKIVDELLWGDPENSIVTREDLDELLRQPLSREAAQRLLDITDEPARRYHLGLWMAPLLSGAPERTNTGVVDFQQRFSKRDARSQNALEYLPEEEVRRQLSQPTLAGVQPGSP